MPLYQFECRSCGASDDRFASVAERNDSQSCATCGATLERVISRAYAVSDLASYIAVSGDRAGRPVEGRKDHREFLKRNGFREVGNEPVKPIKNNFKPAPGAIRQELRRVVPEVLRSGRRG